MSSTEPEVLVVDDEEDVADAYALRLEREYETRTAYGGEDALETIDDDVAVVLLDRRMPEMSGDEVLDAVRDRGYDCRVIMVTAVDPDFDIIDMPFDDYLRKPVDRETLFDAIEEQLDAREKDEAVSELFSVTAKAGVLEQRKSSEELADHEEYQQLKARAEELRARIHGEDAVDDESGPADHGIVDESGAGDGAAETAGGGGGSDGTATTDDGSTGESKGLVGRILALLRG